MSSINIITPPDFLYNQAISFLLIRPSKEVRIQFELLLKKFEDPLNVYLYSPENNDAVDYKWLLAASQMADFVILDLDNLNSIEKNLAGYFVSLPNTFYLTKDEVTPYNMISVHRIYNLDWLYERLQKRGINE
jgi:hypothetical protein